MRNKIKSLFQISRTRGSNLLNPKEGYDIWAETYEDSENLMQHLDHTIVDHLLSEFNPSNKVVLDFGCGTGRHWPKISDHSPSKIIGCDISQNMLTQLKSKIPQADTFLLKDHKLSFLKDNSIDYIFSTLTIGHVQDLKLMIDEWNRVAQDDALIILTGNHPKALQDGIQRSFSSYGKSYSIANTIHTFVDIRTSFKSVGWSELYFEESNIGNEHETWFAKKNALKSYQQMLGKPVIYSMVWKKGNVKTL